MRRTAVAKEDEKLARILVVEDDPNMRTLVVEILEDYDHHVRGEPSGQRALERARSEAFDLVITDVRMEGMDGIECLAQLRTILPEARSIVITGYASSDAPGRAIEVEAEDYLHKPFTSKQLMAAVDRVLDSAAEASSYQSLLQKAVSGYRSLLDWARSGTERSAMERARDQVFHACYVAIRSGILSRRDTYQFWLRLEDLEDRREQLGEQDNYQELQALSEGYRYLVDLLKALREPDRLSLFTRPRSDQASPEQAQYLFEQVRQGVVSPEQLKFGYFLRRLDPSVLQQSEDLSDFRRELWGA